jgi:hypothetical protein
LHKTLWNRGQAADLLKISRWTSQRKMLKYDLGKKKIKIKKFVFIKISDHGANLHSFGANMLQI